MSDTLTVKDVEDMMVETACRLQMRRMRPIGFLLGAVEFNLFADNFEEFSFIDLPVKRMKHPGVAVLIKPTTTSPAPQTEA